MGNHAILKTLKTGDVINATIEEDGAVDVLFSVVLREEIAEDGAHLLYLSRFAPIPVGVPIPYNPYRWDDGVGTLIDSAGDPSFELHDVVFGVEREAGLDVVKRYNKIPRSDQVRVHVSPETRRAAHDDPVVEMINKIIQNGDVRSPADLVSLILDQLGMHHGERELLMLTAAVLQMIAIFGERTISVALPSILVMSEPEPGQSVPTPQKTH